MNINIEMKHTKFIQRLGIISALSCLIAITIIRQAKTYVQEETLKQCAIL